MKKYNLVTDTISKNELFKLSKWIRSAKKLTMGNLCIKFEKKFSSFIKRKYSIFVNSGSSANLLMAKSLLEANYLRNKIIIAPALSWSTTIMPFEQLGYDIKLCDCDPDNLGLDIKHLEKLCKKYKPSTIILVHVLGHANNMKKILQICKKYKIFLLEDTCEALGSKFKNINLGNFSLMSSYSFYYGHHMSTIEGGMVCTNDKKLNNILLSIRSHGWIRNYENKEKRKIEKKLKISNFQSFFTFIFSGFNVRPTEINAFLGLEQLKKINTYSKIRELNFINYKKLLTKFYNVECETNLLSNFGYATLVKNRDAVYKYLKRKKIESRPIIAGNIAKQPFWIKKHKTHKLKNADTIHKYGIYLPNHPKLSRNDINFITKTFKKIAKPIFFK